MKKTSASTVHGKIDEYIAEIDQAIDKLSDKKKYQSIFNNLKINLTSIKNDCNQNDLISSKVLLEMKKIFQESRAFCVKVLQTTPEHLQEANNTLTGGWFKLENYIDEKNVVWVASFFKAPSPHFFDKTLRELELNILALKKQEMSSKRMDKYIEKERQAAEKREAEDERMPLLSKVSHSVNSYY